MIYIDAKLLKLSKRNTCCIIILIIGKQRNLANVPFHVCSFDVKHTEIILFDADWTQTTHIRVFILLL